MSIVTRTGDEGMTGLWSGERVRKEDPRVEAYVPTRDLYIEKDADINAEIERHRLSATRSLMERRDVIIVATVSCIYGLATPEVYREMKVEAAVGEELDPVAFKRELVSLQYERNDSVLESYNFV